MREIVSPLSGIRSPFSGRRAFSPRSLFASGAQGVWYQNILGNAFVNATGDEAHPTDVADEAIGLIYDQSQGAVLSANLITDPNFDDPAAWALGAGISIASGQVTFASVSSGVLARNSAAGNAVTGAWYRYRFEIMSFTAGGLRTGNSTPVLASTSIGFHAATIRSTNTTDFSLRANGTTSAVADNFTMQTVAGNHGIQSLGTARPLYKTTPTRMNFDGTDDRLSTFVNPSTSGSLVARIKGTAASKFVIGSQGASDGRAGLGLAADGAVAAGIGTEGFTTIKGVTDLRNTWATVAVTWDGSTVKLYQGGTEVYSAAQSGAVNTTVPYTVGANNNNTLAQSFWAGDIGAVISIDRVLTPVEINNLNTYWSTIA